jgi:hypothetical protein
VFSNRALLENNARLAARLARELTAAGSSREEIQRRMEGGR